MIDCVVVGGGPAGLAASLALTACGVEHIVLERGRAGQTWRTQRWDTFRLNTPAGPTGCWARSPATPTWTASRRCAGSTRWPYAARCASLRR